MSAYPQLGKDKNKFNLNWSKKYFLEKRYTNFFVLGRLNPVSEVLHCGGLCMASFGVCPRIFSDWILIANWISDITGEHLWIRFAKFSFGKKKNNNIFFLTVPESKNEKRLFLKNYKLQNLDFFFIGFRTNNAHLLTQFSHF